MKLIHIFTLLIALGTISCSESSKKSDDTNAAASTETQETKISVESPAMDPNLFFEAALNGNFELVKKGLNSGLKVNQTDENQHTALMLSAYNGHNSIVSLLLKNKADVDLTDVQNRTALMFASSGPFDETVQLLLEAGASVNIVDNVEQFTALMFAAAEGQVGIVKMLLEKGADKNLKDIDGDGAYEFAKANGHTEVLPLLK